MRAIVAIDQNFGIGAEGQLLQPISRDLKRFKELTMGGVLIYGSKTLLTFPRQKPLPGRKNLILSRKLAADAVPGAEIFPSLPACLSRVQELKTEGYSEDQIWVIGGASVYALLLPYVDQVSLTRIDNVYQADVHFPDLTQAGFSCVEVGDWLEEDGIRFRYEEWERIG
jgi:dihydrofolate reductase